MVVGVHSPEFDFEKNHGNVEAAVTRLHVDLSGRARRRHGDLERVRQQLLAGRLRRRPHRPASATCTSAKAATTKPRTCCASCSASTPARPAPVADERQERRSRPSEATRHARDLPRARARAPRTREPGASTYPEPEPVLDHGDAPARRALDRRRRRTSPPGAPGAAIVLALPRRRGQPRDGDRRTSGPIDVQVDVDGEPLAPAYRTARPRRRRRRTFVHGRDLRPLPPRARRPSSSTHTLAARPPAPGLAGVRLHVRRLSARARATRSRCSAPASRRSSRRASCRCCPAYLGIIAGEAADARDPARAVPGDAVFVARLRRSSSRRSAPRPAARLVARRRPGRASQRRRRGARRRHGPRAARRGPRSVLARATAGAPAARAARARSAPSSSASRSAPRGARASGRCSAPRSRSRPARGEPGRGALLLLAYALGIGVPFLLASLGLASSPRLADGSGASGPSIERVAGVLLVVLGVLLATGPYAHLTSYLARFTPAIGGL